MNMLNVVMELEEKYVGKSVLELDIFSLIYLNKATQGFELGLDVSSKQMGKGEEYAKRVNLKEWIFGILCACPDVTKFEDEINELFYKRMYEISDNSIKEHMDWSIYVQTGQSISSAVKLSLILQHELFKSKIHDLDALVNYHVTMISDGKCDLTVMMEKCDKEVINLIKKMLVKAKKTEGKSPAHLIQKMGIEQIADLVRYKKFEVNPNVCSSVFYLGVSNILNCMSDDSVHEKYPGLSTEEVIKKYFNNSNFEEVSIAKMHKLFEYVVDSENYIQRIIKKGNLDVYGVGELDPFVTSASINTFLPKGNMRTDYQFILYLFTSHALNSYNKAVRGHMELGCTKESREKQLTSYMLGERFGLEGKELNNFAITINIMLSLVDEINRVSKTHLDEVVKEILALKKSEAVMSKQVIDIELEKKALKVKLDKEYKGRESVLIKEKNKVRKAVEKDIYDVLKQQFEDKIEMYKNEIKGLKEEIQNRAESKEKSMEELPVNDVIYASDLNVLFVGDSQFRIELLESLFKSVKKIDGHNAKNLSNDSVLAGVDLVVLQYTHCQHTTESIINEAEKRNIKVIYVKHVNSRKVIDEIYSQIYK